jgi:hypothetical protein
LPPKRHAKIRSRLAACFIVTCAVTAAACDGGDSTERSPDANTGADVTPAAGRTAATVPPPVLSEATLSVDADVASNSVETSGAHGVGEEFDVAVTLDQLEQPAAGYQLDLSWNSSVVTFVALQNAAADAFPTCSPTLSAPSSASTYCLRTDGETEYTGQLARIRMRCLGAGESPIELRSPGAEVVGTKIESAPGRNVVHELTLRSATITCG